ncbi:MAG: hypothetical protein WCJ35_19980, partial [Planctomycetota bacterium]
TTHLNFTQKLSSAPGPPQGIGNGIWITRVSFSVEDSWRVSAYEVWSIRKLQDRCVPSVPGQVATLLGDVSPLDSPFYHLLHFGGELALAAQIRPGRFDARSPVFKVASLRSVAKHNPFGCISCLPATHKTFQL